MNDKPEIKGRHGGGHLFWGTVFTIFGIMAFFRNVMTVAGIPLWALSFLSLGISHLLKAPRVQNLLGLSGERARRVTQAAGILNLAALASIVISVAIAWSSA